MSSLIAGEEATRTSLSNLQENARDASAVLAARLDAVKLQLNSVTSWSDSQMAHDEPNGGSCAVTSGAGRGPLYNARSSVRSSVTSLRDNIGQTWIAPVQRDIEVPNKAASRLEGGTIEERQARFEAMHPAYAETFAGLLRAAIQSVDQQLPKCAPWPARLQ